LKVDWLWKDFPMRETFIKYAQEMGLTPAGLEKVSDILAVASRLLPEELEEIFISQSLEEEGQVTEWDSLWLFSKNYCLEARQFMVQQDLEIYPLQHLQGFRLVLENMRLSQFASSASPGGKANVTVEFCPARGGRCQLFAFGANGSKLGVISTRYLTSHLAHPY
jgi:hypothetical protein